MAYLFTASSSQRITTTSSPVTAPPLTIACWFFATESTTTGTLVSLSPRTGTADRRYNLFYAGSIAGDPVRYYTASATGIQASADTTTGYTANRWHHACATSESSSHSVYIDGGSKSTATLATSPPDINTVAIGARYATSWGVYANARIAEVGVWSAALSEGEITSLARGVSPSLIRPQSLAFYAPLVRDLVDVRGGLELTNTGSATVADHPRVYA